MIVKKSSHHYYIRSEPLRYKIPNSNLTSLGFLQWDVVAKLCCLQHYQFFDTKSTSCLNLIVLMLIDLKQPTFSKKLYNEIRR